MIFMKFKIFLEKVSGSMPGDDFKNFLNVVDLKILLVIFANKKKLKEKKFYLP